MDSTRMVLPKRIGKCIYCGSTEPALTTEHVIPEALGGTELLLEATCEECQRKTAAAENAIGESLLPLLRREGILGKNKGGRLNKRGQIRLKGVNRFGRKYSKDVALNKVGILAIFPVTATGPRLLSGVAPETALSLSTYIMYEGGNIGPIEAPGAFIRLNPSLFFTMIAKIAHAQAVWSFWLDCFEPVATNLIRGIDPDWAKYVGSCPEKIPQLPGRHVVSAHTHVLNAPHEGKLLGRVRIAECLGAPVYDVFIGRLLPGKVLVPATAFGG
jgi:hypothetical protein